MRIRSISDIENELEVVRQIAKRNRQAVESSDRPLVDEIFAASSDKRQKILERELEHAKSERAHEVFSLKLHSPMFSPGTIPLRVLLRFAPLLNDALEQSAWREQDINGDVSTIDDGFRRQVNLRLAGIREGSTELVFLGNIAPDLTGESALERGLRNFFNVLSAPNDQFTDRANSIGKNATKSVARLMKAFELENLAAEFTWRAPDNQYHWDGRPDEITRVRTLLEEIGDPETQVVAEVGTVSALSRRRVQIETDAGQKISVCYHPSVREEVTKLHLDECCRFDLEVTSYPADTLGLRRNAYRLVGISPLKSEASKQRKRSGVGG